MRIRLAVVGIFVLGVVLVGAATSRPASALSCGPCPATATDYLNLREGPSLDDDVLLVIPAWAELEWDPAETRQNGFVAVNYDGTDGWAYAAYLILFPMTATTTDWLNLRDDPSLSAEVITVMPMGADVQVLSGPDNGFFSVRYGEQAGWAYGDYLDFGGGGGDFDPGDVVVVATDALNLRAGPGLGEDVLTVLFQGKRLEILDEPETAAGYVWYEVDAGNAGEGWVAGAYLAAA
jgi:uncharacterized protein YgiM (DUF1202 family)